MVLVDVAITSKPVTLSKSSLLDLVMCQIRSKLLQFILTFKSASFVGIPHKNEWGPSVSINELVTDGKSVFNIHMQSGDIISIKANEYIYETNNT